MPLMFYQALQASGGFLIIYLLQLAWQKPVSAAAKPLDSVLPLPRRVFSAQDCNLQKLKICSELSGNKLSEHVFKMLSVA